MKAVILAGGLGTRLSEETSIRPKPMVEIGGKPILWHIMKIYSSYGINEFIICCGYKGYLIKEYFANYFLHQSDITVDLQKNSLHYHQSNSEPWKITLVDTGEQTMTGGRLKRVQQYVGNETFCFTYGDGVADIDLDELIKFHKTHGKNATVTAVQPPGRFGSMVLAENTVTRFAEKSQSEESWINAGFFVLEPSVFDLIEDDDTIWETGPLSKLAEQRHLQSFKHRGFWQPMDTLREKTMLETLWTENKAPWKMWKR